MSLVVDIMGNPLQGIPMKLDTTSPLEHLATVSIAFAMGFAAHAMIAWSERRARRAAERMQDQQARSTPPVPREAPVR
jgi:hypothetical protein